MHETTQVAGVSGRTSLPSAHLITISHEVADERNNESDSSDNRRRAPGFRRSGAISARRNTLVSKRYGIFNAFWILLAYPRSRPECLGGAGHQNHQRLGAAFLKTKLATATVPGHGREASDRDAAIRDNDFFAGGNTLEKL